MKATEQSLLKALALICPQCGGGLKADYLSQECTPYHCDTCEYVTPLGDVQLARLLHAAGLSPTPMSRSPALRFKWSFDLHVGHQSPYSDDVVGFDIYHRWKVVNYDNQWFDELALKGESMLILDEEFDPADDGDLGWGKLFTEKHGHHQITGGTGVPPVSAPQRTRRLAGEVFDTVRFQAGRQQSRPFEYNARGSGGNWYWEIIRFPQAEQPHVLNWLRRVMGKGNHRSQHNRWFDITEWDNAFGKQIWNARHSLTRRDLRRYTGQCIRAYLRDQREQFGDEHVDACFARYEKEHHDQT